MDPDDASYYFYYYEYPHERALNEYSDKNFFRSSEAYLNLAGLKLTWATRLPPARP